MKYILVACFFALCLSCTQNSNHVEDAQLGDLDHQFPVSEAARPSFEKGLLLLHSFEYDDAREAFEKAREADPNEVMVYWGLAMTHYKALWGLQDVDAGREVIQQLGKDREDRLSKAENELERDFWLGIEILYGEGELLERNQKYVDHMAQVYEDHPDNLEVAAFYSLGLMWADYDNQEYLDKSSDIAAGIIEENPTHPGALHYMIHANDNPKFAKVAIHAADQYAKVAPDATHALHMPSHIYVALGMWNEVVSSNEASYQASLNRVERKNLDGTERGYHSMAWLHYGYLQQGRYDKAAELLEEMIEYHKDSTASISYLINMQNQQRVEAGYWPDHLEMQDIDVTGYQLGLESKSQMHFLRSLLAYDEKNVNKIEKEIKSLTDILESAKLLVTNDGIALCSAGPTRYAPHKQSIAKTKVVIHQMNALAAMLKEDKSEVETHFKQAIALEQEAGYDPGPPFIAYPSFEQYGDWLLIQNRHEEALEQFNLSLKSREKRTKALKGKMAALKALNREEEAKEVAEILAQHFR
ncbi:MAG: hypothetical protein R3345_10115 [Fulvivirga sp.]|nr:hypothetical protein [Fulvivirga sp.]